MDRRGNETEAGYTDLLEIASPTSPAAGYLRTYAKSDNNLYTKTSAGVETKVGSGGGGTNAHRVFRSSSSTGPYVTCASNAAFNIGSPSKFTVRMWFRALVANLNNGLATRGDLSSTQGDWTIVLGNASIMNVNFRLNNNAVNLASVTTLVAGAWYFLECSYDSSLGSNNLKMFINGVLDAQANYSTIITNNANQLAVGAYFDATHQQNGYISEFEFSAGVVRNTVGYTAPSTIAADANTTVLYTMNEDYVTSGTVTDTSGNSHNGTVQNTYLVADNSVRMY
jgi:hypothetical protein